MELEIEILKHNNPTTFHIEQAQSNPYAQVSKSDDNIVTDLTLFAATGAVIRAVDTFNKYGHQSRRAFLMSLASLINGAAEGAAVGLLTACSEATTPYEDNRQLVDTLVYQIGLSQLSQEQYAQLALGWNNADYLLNSNLGNINGRNRTTRLVTDVTGEPDYFLLNKNGSIASHGYPEVIQYDRPGLKNTTFAEIQVNGKDKKIVLIGTIGMFQRLQGHEEELKQFADSYLPDAPYSQTLYFSFLPIDMDIGNIGVFPPIVYQRANAVTSRTSSPNGDIISTDGIYCLQEIHNRAAGLGITPADSLAASLANERWDIIRSTDTEGDWQRIEGPSTAVGIIAMLDPAYRNLLIGQNYEAALNFLASEMNEASKR